MTSTTGAAARSLASTVLTAALCLGASSGHAETGPSANGTRKPPEVVQVDGETYVRAGSSRLQARGHVLKHGDTFAVLDRQGEVQPWAGSEQGVYHLGTRFVSALTVRLFGGKPEPLAAAVTPDGSRLEVDLTNADFSGDGSNVLSRNTLHVRRSTVLHSGACFIRTVVTNHGSTTSEVLLSLTLGADFADVFEVRGTKRARRGDGLQTETGRDWLALAYRGLDGKLRRTRAGFEPAPSSLSGETAEFRPAVGPKSSWTLDIVLRFETGDATASLPGIASGEATGASTSVRAAGTFAEACEAWQRSADERRRRGARIRTSNPQLDAWLERSTDDVGLLSTDTPFGPYPYAGIPWFSTPFGRDGILTALECLWADPALARGVLGYLSATQATGLDPARDAEPGKILHEARAGEMPELGEVPYGRYYGSVDSTPLFVMLAHAHWRRTGDLEHLRGIWPNVLAALEWMDRHGDPDGDGFVQYRRRSKDGLANQGWKDSESSVFHSDGSPALGDIALCEVQGYAYAARKGAAEMAAALGDPALSGRLEKSALELSKKFDGAFWCDELQTYALALDGEKQPCRVRTSNAGHVLFTGLATPARGRAAALTLMSPDSFSGWGIRTVASSETAYNPVSYHNGSVWPHDTALVAAGLARYGLVEEAARVFTALFEASATQEGYRLPELFCGFERSPGLAPTAYPVACSPQAWAAGVPLLLLGECLGIRVDAPAGVVRVVRPVLPEGVDWIAVENLRVGEGSLDLTFRREGTAVSLASRSHGDPRLRVLLEER